MDEKQAWRVNHQGKTHGPFTRQQITELISAGRLGDQDMIQSPDLEWMTVEVFLRAEERRRRAMTDASVQSARESRSLPHRSRATVWATIVGLDTFVTLEILRVLWCLSLVLAAVFLPMATFETVVQGGELQEIALRLVLIWCFTSLWLIAVRLSVEWTAIVFKIADYARDIRESLIRTEE